MPAARVKSWNCTAGFPADEESGPRPVPRTRPSPARASPALSLRILLRFAGCAGDRLLQIVSCLAGFLGRGPVRLCLAIGVRLPPRPTVSVGQQEMGRRIVWLQPGCLFQRGHSLRSPFGGQQRSAEPDKGIGESHIELRGPGETLDGLRIVLCLSGQLSQDEFCARVGGIVSEFLLELLLCLRTRGSRFRFGKDRPAQPVMNSRKGGGLF